MTRSTKTSIALFCLSCALGITPAAADDVARNTRYLALGDISAAERSMDCLYFGNKFYLGRLYS